jgi:uncharacterized protein (DUF488 family)
MREVYTAGYSGRTPEVFKKIVVQMDAVVLDIRFSPVSRNPRCGKGSLECLLNERYKHVRAFGNRNYRGGAIELVDPEAGVKIVEKLKKTAILLCVCADYESCHRKVVAELLRMQDFNVSELGEVTSR